MTVSDYFDLSKPGDYTILVWGGEVPEDTMMVGIGGASAERGDTRLGCKADSVDSRQARCFWRRRTSSCFHTAERAFPRNLH